MKKILLTVIIIVFSACTTNGTVQIESIEQISDNKKLYSIEDFIDLGFKSNKNYDVKDLPGASKVVHGFWKTPNKEAIDYEIRIYPSHEEALNLGMKFAKERSGNTALLDESEASWKEGLKESRFCTGPTRAGGGVNCALPKYNNFYIFSNSIILCQGRNLEEATINCEFLINSLNN
ncbi:MAG: hypothetical protein CL764_01150 [Chloroflexi bacterium]|nr:hypothetical protein [Chloroflexota bacterium]|tara:strand:- start:822 stop:1352 length:531 start_codon:yes stop_codon:yes gene_type:complete